MRVLRPLVSERAASTIHVHDLQWGLRVGRFAHIGPSSGIGRKRGALVRRRRRMAIAVPLASAAGVFIAGIVYGLHERKVAPSEATGRQWVAAAQPEAGTRLLQVDVPPVATLARLTRERHARFWQRMATLPRVPRHNEADPQIGRTEPEARSVASSEPPTNANIDPAPKRNSDTLVTAQRQGPTPGEQPHKGKVVAYVKSPLDQNGAPTNARPQRDRSAHRRVQSSIKAQLRTAFSASFSRIGEVRQGLAGRLML